MDGAHTRYEIGYCKQTPNARFISDLFLRVPQGTGGGSVRWTNTTDSLT